MIVSGLGDILRPAAGVFVTSQRGSVSHCATEKKGKWGRLALAASAYTADEPSAAELPLSGCSFTQRHASCTHTPTPGFSQHSTGLEHHSQLEVQQNTMF